MNMLTDRLDNLHKRIGNVIADLDQEIVHTEEKNVERYEEMMRMLREAEAHVRDAINRSKG
jgi:hypothetical protein